MVHPIRMLLYTYLLTTSKMAPYSLHGALQCTNRALIGNMVPFQNVPMSLPQQLCCVLVNCSTGRARRALNPRAITAIKGDLRVG